MRFCSGVSWSRALRAPRSLKLQHERCSVASLLWSKHSRSSHNTPARHLAVVFLEEDLVAHALRERRRELARRLLDAIANAEARCAHVFKRHWRVCEHIHTQDSVSTRAARQSSVRRVEVSVPSLSPAVVVVVDSRRAAGRRNARAARTRGSSESMRATWADGWMDRWTELRASECASGSSSA